MVWFGFMKIEVETAEEIIPLYYISPSSIAPPPHHPGQPTKT